MQKQNTPLPLAVGLIVVALCFFGAGVISDKQSLDSHLKASVTSEASQARTSQALDRNLTAALLPQGASVTAVHCQDSSGANLALERSGSEYILSGQFQESLISLVPVSLTMSFDSTRSPDEGSLSFENLRGDLHVAETESKIAITKLEIRGLKDRYGAQLVVHTAQLQIELSGCLVNTTALLRLNNPLRQPALASAK